MMRTLVMMLLAAHGIGHVLFLVPLLGLADWGQSTRSWLLTGSDAARMIGGVIWIFALAGFILAVFGLGAQQGWWRAAAVGASVLSSLGLLLFWMNPPASPVISALAFDLVVLAALVFAQWPTVDLVGA